MTSVKNEEFREIRPRRPWWEFNWAEVWEYKHLVRFLVERDLKLLYKQTILGPLHLFIRLFVMTLLFQLVFHRLGGMSTDGVHPFLFYYANNTAWAFFSGTFGAVSSVFISGKGLMTKVYFPRIIMPLSSVLTNGFNLLIQLCFLVILVLGFWLSDKASLPSWPSVLIFIPLIQLALIGIGGGFVFASLTLKYRDLKSLSGVIVQGMMYLSPVIYPLAMVPEKYQLLASLNPITSAMELLRYCLFSQGTITPLLIGIGWGMSLGVFIFGLVSFNLMQRKFVDIV